MRWCMLWVTMKTLQEAQTLRAFATMRWHYVYTNSALLTVRIEVKAPLELGAIWYNGERGFNARKLPGLDSLSGHAAIGCKMAYFLMLDPIGTAEDQFHWARKPKSVV